MNLHLDIATTIVSLLVVIMSVTVHELAHAYMAYRLGDDTAAREGRLTLNPLVLMRAEPMGMVILPLLGTMSGWMMAFASTPVSLHRVDRRWTMRQANFLISLAGPVSNLLLAILNIGVLVVLQKAGLLADPNLGQPLSILAERMVGINAMLFVFNLLPVHPLDGFSVLFSLLPRAFDGLRETIRAHGMVITMVLMFTGARFLSPVIRGLLDLLYGLAGRL